MERKWQKLSLLNEILTNFCHFPWIAATFRTHIGDLVMNLFFTFYTINGLVSPKKANLTPKMAEHDRPFNVPMWFKKVQNGQPNYETKKNVRKRSKFYQNRTLYHSFLAINGNLWVRKNLSTHI